LKKKNLKKFSTILRIVVGVGLIAFLLWRFDINKILNNIGSISTGYLIYAFIVYFLFVIVSAWRWQVLLDFKNFMKKRRADALATVLVDRILGFVGLFVFALFAVLYLLIEKKQTEFLPFIIIGLIIIIFITYIFFSEKVYSKLSLIVQKIKVFRLGERLNRLHEATTDFGGAWGPITLCIIHSIIIQAFLAIGPFLVLRGMGNSEVGLLPFFVYLPIINVVSMIPISLNALGVREYFYVLLFSRAGLAGETSLAVSLVSFFLIFLLSITGGIFFIFYKKR
jgi:uncharacterized protein (TIRG00374 family)